MSLTELPKDLKGTIMQALSLKFLLDLKQNTAVLNLTSPVLMLKSQLSNSHMGSLANLQELRLTNQMFPSHQM